VKGADLNSDLKPLGQGPLLPEPACQFCGDEEIYYNGLCKLCTADQYDGWEAPDEETEDEDCASA
jgi:hypothetical protein